MNERCRIVIGIATSGRREQLHATLTRIGRQRRAPTRVIVCPARADDFDATAASTLPFNVEVVTGAMGLCAQRNAILRVCSAEELIVFLDDDFYPAADYVAEAVDLMSRAPDIVLATHHPMLDGANGSGIKHEEAERVVDEFDACVPPEEQLSEMYAGYGCNMVLRLSTVRANAIWFDENLPLYSWLEDVDFSRRLAHFGRIVESNRLRGVHLGTKRGKTSGVRLGYSQIANPLYMLRKGSLSMSYALRQMSRNVAKNAVMVFWPEPWVDRVGRCKGNAIALAHLAAGRLHPQRISELE
ncbi:MAG TPA: glycosyltransferase [Polyangiaceae bacterium]